MGRRQTRYCITCGGTHRKPTGQKCKRLQQLEALENQQARDASPSSQETELAIGAEAAREEPPIVNQPLLDNDRFSRMEKLVERMAEVVFTDHNNNLNDNQRGDGPGRNEKPQGPGSDGSTSDTSGRHVRRRSRQHKIFAQDRHVNPGEVVNTFESLMVVTFRTLLDMGERAIPMSGLISHGLTMAEKAASGAYLDRACIAYDASVRQRALRVGHDAFGNPINEDLIRHFSLENSKRFDNRNGQGGRKKRSNTCFRFNSDAGCNSKECIYTHRCNSCKQEGHSMKDCRASDRAKSSK